MLALVYLIDRAEDMSIVLLETAHTGESGKSTRELISVKNAKVSHPPWQILVSDI